MKQALLIIDVQPSFSPPDWQVEGIDRVSPTLHSVALVERHNEAVTPDVVQYFRDSGIQRVLVCGIQADTCCLAAGFMLFDAGLYPTLLKWLTVGSSLDRSANLGAQLWRHHFGKNSVLESEDELKALSASGG